MALKEVKMAGLNLDPSRWEGDEEDEGEQSDMLAILMKIKEAKLVIDK